MREEKVLFDGVTNRSHHPYRRIKAYYRRRQQCLPVAELGAPLISLPPQFFLALEASSAATISFCLLTIYLLLGSDAGLYRILKALHVQIASQPIILDIRHGRTELRNGFLDIRRRLVSFIAIPTLTGPFWVRLLEGGAGSLVPRVQEALFFLGSALLPRLRSTLACWVKSLIETLLLAAIVADRSAKISSTRFRVRGTFGW